MNRIKILLGDCAILTGVVLIFISLIHLAQLDLIRLLVGVALGYIGMITKDG